MYMFCVSDLEKIVLEVLDCERRNASAGACVTAGPGPRTVSCCCHFVFPGLENCGPDRLG